MDLFRRIFKSRNRPTALAKYVLEAENVNNLEDYACLRFMIAHLYLRKWMIWTQMELELDSYFTSSEVNHYTTCTSKITVLVTDKWSLILVLTSLDVDGLRTGVSNWYKSYDNYERVEE